MHLPTLQNTQTHTHTHTLSDDHMWETVSRSQVWSAPLPTPSHVCPSQECWREQMVCVTSVFDTRHAQPSWEQTEQTCVLTTESQPVQVTNACLETLALTSESCRKTIHQKKYWPWTHALLPMEIPPSHLNYSPTVSFKITFVSHVSYISRVNNITSSPRKVQWC